MSQAHLPPKEGSRHGGPGTYDGEIDVKGIVDVGIWLAVVSIVSFAIVWFFYKGLSNYEKRTLDARPSPLAEANTPRVIPGPQLLARPELDLAAYRAQERERLNGWGWSDAGKTRAHVPVDKAMEAVAAAGLPDFAASTTSPTSPTAEPPAEAPAP